MLTRRGLFGPITATTVILASQLLLTTIIALALAFVLSAFLSRQLSKPIVLMSQSAQHLPPATIPCVSREADTPSLTS